MFFQIFSVQLIFPSYLTLTSLGEMSYISGNIAAWLPTEKAAAVEIGPGPTPDPAENEVVIEVAYAAVNPTDWMVGILHVTTRYCC